jgi:hypothetical protein
MRHKTGTIWDVIRSNSLWNRMLVGIKERAERMAQGR